MIHDILAITFLFVMIVGAFMYRRDAKHDKSIRVPKKDAPIKIHENKMGLHGEVVNALYDCVEIGAEVPVEPSAFEVPSHSLVNHMIKQLCIRSSKDNLEFFPTSTIYAGTQVFTDDTRLHDICCIVHEKQTLTNIRLRFLALCDTEDDGVIFVSMKFDPLDSSPGEMSYMRSGDCIPCHETLDPVSMGL
jgi:hypothetical protein